MKERQVCGECYYFESDDNQGKKIRQIFQEANKNMAQSAGPAIIVTIKKSNAISDIRLVPNLDKTFKKYRANADCENRYFFKCVNTLNPISYHFILERKLVFCSRV